MQSAQGEYDKVSWRGDVGASSQAATLQTATLDYNSAKAAYESVAATAKSDADSKVASALSSLQSARVNYTKVKASVTQAELAAAQSSLTQAKNNLDELLAGPTAAELGSAQNSVESAQIALSQVKLKLQQAQVIAPFDGVITTISAKIGQTASGTAMEIADLDRLIISVNMSEVDINKVKVGQPAQVTLDAVMDASFSGLVSLIAPAGVQSSGVVNYPVTVVVDKPTEAVKTGMTANVNITVQKSENVLLVPNRAVKTVNRQKVVTVLLEGRQVVVPVQTGLSGDSMTEISNGLKEGDLVVVNATTTSTSTRGMGIGVPGIGGGGPPPGM